MAASSGSPHSAGATQAPDRAPETIPGTRLNLRRIDEGDRPHLREILAEPEVARWWAPRGADEAVAGLFDGEEVVYAIELDGAVIGAIEYYEENEPDYRHAGIDIFVATAHQGRRLGSEAIRLLARYLFDGRGHHRLIIDPAAANERAIKAYERVGFRRVGVMRAYERGADGTWHDGLLLDLLAAEFEDGLVHTAAGGIGEDHRAATSRRGGTARKDDRRSSRPAPYDGATQRLRPPRRPAGG